MFAPAETLRTRAGPWIVRGLLATLITLAGIHYSLRHGRLIYRPMADDANYFIDGLQRLDALDRGGLVGLVKSLTNDPPHAPFSTLLAMTSFAVFGIHDWAPYAGNVVVILMLLVMVDRLLGPSRPWQKGLAYLLVLCCRLSWNGVVEFRPDIAAGLVTAFALLLISSEDLIAASLSWRVKIGALIGLSLLIKPTLAPVNAIIMAVAVLWQTLGKSPRLSARQLAPLVLIALAVCLPYYAFGLPTTIRYIRANVFGARREIWIYNAPLGDQLAYYLGGRGADFLLGVGETHVFIVLFVTGWIMNYRSAKPPGRKRLIGLAMVLLIAFAMPSFSKTKNAFFGATFQSMLMLGSIAGLRRLLASRRPLAIGTTATMCVASLFFFQWPLNRGEPDLAPASTSNRLLNQVYSTIQTGQIGDRIFVPAPGQSVSWNTMNYLSMLDQSHRRFINLDYGQWNDDSLLNTEMDQADWIVLGDPGNDEGRGDLPNNRLGLPKYMQWLKTRDDFDQVATFPAYGQKLYHVYRRNTKSFGGIASISGLGPEDGPHPEWGLPIVRSSFGQAMPLQVLVNLPNSDVLAISFASSSPGQELSLWHDGKLLASQTCDDRYDFSDVRLPLTFPAGLLNLELRCAAVTDPISGKPAIVFKKIQVLGP